MTETKKKNARAVEPQHPLLRLVHRVLLAAIGAAVLAQEEIEEFVDKLIERGEIAEKDGKALIRDLRERRAKGAAGAQERFDEQVAAALSRVNLPSRSDIEAISAKVAELNAKLDELNKS